MTANAAATSGIWASNGNTVHPAGRGTSVTAVVVTNGRNFFLPLTLAALARQTTPPDRVVVIDASGSCVSWEELGVPAVVEEQLPARQPVAGLPTSSGDDEDRPGGAAAVPGEGAAGAGERADADADGDEALAADAPAGEAPADNVLAADVPPADVLAAGAPAVDARNADAPAGEAPAPVRPFAPAGSPAPTAPAAFAVGSRAALRAGTRALPPATGGEAQPAGPVRLDLENWELRCAPAPTLGAALQSLRQEDLGQWLWVLHSDGAPEPGCLTELLRVGTQGTTVGMVGAKQMGWLRPETLLAVGTRPTARGKRLQDIEAGDIDQGQLDGRTDVLSVSTAGALLRTAAWREVGGLDPHLGPFGEAMEYGRRLWRARWRVVVAPQAVVRHARQNLRCVTQADQQSAPERSYGRRRAAGLHYWLAGLPLWRFLPAMALVLPLSILRAIWRLATKRARMAAGELWAAAYALLRLPRVLATRRRVARAAKTGRGVLKPLQCSEAEWIGRELERWRHQSVMKERVKAPSEMEIAQVRAMRQRRRFALTSGVLLCLLGTVWAFAVVGLNPSGPAYATLSGTLLEQFELARSDLGIASTTLWPGLPPVATAVALLAAPFTLAFSLPQAVALVHYSLPVLAFVFAWAAAGLGTRRVRVRLVIALVWVSSPAFLAALAEGRTPVAVAHAFLPVALFFVGRAAGFYRADQLVRWRDYAGGGARRFESAVDGVSYLLVAPRISGVTAAAGAGLTLAILWSVAPIYLLLAPVLLWVLRRKLLLLPVVLGPAAALLGPWLWRLLDAQGEGEGLGSLAASLADTGVLTPSQAVPAWLAPLLPSVLLDPLLALPTLLIALVGLWTYLVSPVGRPALRWGLTVATLGATLAVWAPRVFLGTATVESGEIAVAGTGHLGASLLLAGLLVMVAGGRPAPSPRRARAKASEGRAAALSLRPGTSWVHTVGAAALVVACVASLGLWAHSTRAIARDAASGGFTAFAARSAPLAALYSASVPEQFAGAPVLHAGPVFPVAVDIAHAAPHRARLLYVRAGLYPQVAVREASARQLAQVPGPPGAAQDVASAFAGALTGRASLARTFAAYGVDGVVMPKGAHIQSQVGAPWSTDAVLANALNAAPGLRHASQSEGAVFWRVGEATTGQSNPAGQVTRLRLLPVDTSASASTPLPMGRTSAVAAAEGPGTVALAELAPGWRIFVDGVEVPTRVESGLLVADVPAGHHLIEVDYLHRGAEMVWWFRLGVLAAALLLSLPLRKSRLVGEEQ
ncbi:MAG: glycosyltransferase [Buchananella hordeovulneris]|nr:glycosyltransferase [Buchananella hordeovulneris]